MDDGSRWYWLIIVVLLLFAAMYFAIAETAFASVSRTRLKTKADRGDNRARRALLITDEFDRAITTILIGTNIVHLAAASVVTANVTRIWGVSFVALSTILTTLAVFFFGEMLPKSIARKYSESLSLSTASSLLFFIRLLTPLSSLLTMIGSAMARLFKQEAETSVTENELYEIIEDMTEEGSLDEEQGELISSALQFGDVTVESILTSRVDMAAIDIDDAPEEILNYVCTQNHSRIPVYENTIDNIIGILPIRRFLKRYLKDGVLPDIRPLLESPIFVHQSAKIDDLLPEMSSKKQNLAIVTDNYGGTLGLVSVEDILEELVGEIWDEDDRVVRNIVPLSDGSYSVNAEEHVTDVFDALDIPYDDEEEEKLSDKLMSELAFEQFPSIPKTRDSFEYLGVKIMILFMKGNRILRLKVTPPAAEAAEDKAAAPSADGSVGKEVSV
ncbi:MAG: HlyC/CorC family transporter [Lachnospiraceae bacterium]|nr:HlyC/CorC family transporter [Lachnospiraceae bacterium]